MDEALLERGDERGGHLAGGVERDQRSERSFAFHPGVDRLALDEFHRVEVRVAAGPEMKDRGHIAMAQLGGAAGFSKKTLRGGRIVEMRGADDLQGDMAAQIGIEGLVGHAHGTVAQLRKGAVFFLQKLVMLEFLRLRHREEVFGEGGKLRPSMYSGNLSASMVTLGAH